MEVEKMITLVAALSVGLLGCIHMGVAAYIFKDEELDEEICSAI